MENEKVYNVYKVTVTERLEHVYNVKAGSPEEAQKLIEGKCNEGMIDLDSSNFTGRDIVPELSDEVNPIIDFADTTRINGNEYNIVRKWSTGSARYTLGRETDNGSFYAAKVIESDARFGKIYQYEFDHEPKNEEVENEHENSLANEHLDNMESGYYRARGIDPEAPIRITAASDGIKIPGHSDTWYVIGTKNVDCEPLFLLESEKYGDDAPALIVNEYGRVIADDIHNGFDDLEDRLRNSSHNAENYNLLDRCRADCDYYLNNNSVTDKYLLAGGVKEQISKMRELYDALPDKPDWISKEDIDRYEKAMTAKESELKSRSEDMGRER